MQKEYEVIYTLSQQYSINSLCKKMDINRSGYYKWLKRRYNQSPQEMKRMAACEVFSKYHNIYPSHGYRWLNAKIKQDTGAIYSDNYAHKICYFLGIKSKSKHVRRYGKLAKRELKNFPNYDLSAINPDGPFQIVVSDMTALKINKQYYELTLFMDLFNNEIIAYSLSNKRGDPNTYHDGLKQVLIKKEEYKDFETILHTDQGSVYSSKKFNQSLQSYNIIHSMSKPGKPTENGAMEAINGWIKEELYIDFNINTSNNIDEELKKYIHYFNYERPQYTLNYLTPMQYKNMRLSKKDPKPNS